MISAGYVGLVSGLCFADFGHHVRASTMSRRKWMRSTPGSADIQAGTGRPREVEPQGKR